MRRRSPCTASGRHPTGLSMSCLVAVVALLAGCSTSSLAAPTRPAGRPAVIAYGHSYISGVPGQPPPWPRLLAADLGRPLVEIAHGGDVAARCLSRMEAAADQPIDSDVVVWECDLNDARRWGTDPGHLASFRRTFAAAVGRMRHGKVIVVEDPPITGWGLYPPFNHGSVAALDAYNAIIEQSVTPPVQVVKVLGWNPATMLARDAVHPNDTGKRAIAETVAAAVRSA